MPPTWEETQGQKQGHLQHGWFVHTCPCLPRVLNPPLMIRVQPLTCLLVEFECPENVLPNKHYVGLQAWKSHFESLLCWVSTDIDWPNPRQHWCEDATAAGTKSCHNGSCSKPRCVHHCATCPEDPWKRKRTNFKLMDMERKHSIVQWPKQNINNKFHNLKFDKLKLFHECFGHNLVLTLKFQFWNKKWSKCFFPTFGIKSWSHQAASTFRGRADASDTVDGRNLAPPVMILRCMKPY